MVGAQAALQVSMQDPDGQFWRESGLPLEKSPPRPHCKGQGEGGGSQGELGEGPGVADLQ